MSVVENTTALAAGQDRSITELRDREKAKWVATVKRDRFQKVALGVGFPLALLLVWQSAAWLGLVDERFFPSPLKIVERAIEDMVANGLLHVLGQELLISLGRIGAGFAIGTVAGILIGTAMGSIRRLRYMLGPFVYGIYPMPKLAILPLLLILFGLGDVSKIVLISLGVFFVVGISALSGTLYTAQMYRDVATTFSFTRLMRYRYVILPAAMPSIMNGVKLGIGQALILCVSVEFVSSKDGIGAFIWKSWQTFNIPSMFVGLFCIATAGALAVFGGDALEKKLVPWANNR
jgi:ABC-type nitrate/sulfonate/bicarbonate transport system permease component